MQLTINELQRSSLTKLYWKTGQKVLLAVQQPVIDMADKVVPEVLKERVAGLLNSEPMKNYLNEIWTKVGTHFAVDTMRRLKPVAKGKDQIPEMFLKADEGIDYWEDYFRRYSRERTAFINKEIMDTQTRVVNNIIDRNLEEGKLGGLSIEQMQRYLRTDLQDSLTEMNRYQAERIARTEVIGASNKGSFDGARASGLDMKKAWLTSGLEGIRESHREYEALGNVEMDYEYNTGLMYPSDPDGDPEEIINCRCTVVYEVDEGLVREPEPRPEGEPIPEPELTPEPVAVEPAIVEAAVDINKITTYEELHQVALERVGIDISPSKGILNLQAQKDAVLRIGELKAKYPKATLNNKPLQLKAAKGNVYASAWSDKDLKLNPHYYNDPAVCSKQFISDQITYFHPRGISPEIAAQSIMDHEFAHLMTSTEVVFKNGIYGEVKALKTAYTKTINRLVRQEYETFKKMQTAFYEGYTEAERLAPNPQATEIWSKMYDAHSSWARTKNPEKLINMMNEMSLPQGLKDEMTRIVLEFDKNFISGYAGKNMGEFIAEGFTDAINNKINPSPFSLKIKNIVDKKYKP